LKVNLLELQQPKKTKVVTSGRGGRGKSKKGNTGKMNV